MVNQDSDGNQFILSSHSVNNELIDHQWFNPEHEIVEKF